VSQRHAGKPADRSEGGFVTARTSAAALALCCAAFLAACGGDDKGSNDEVDVAAVVAELQSASKAGDGQKICDQLFTKNLAISVQRASGKSCGEEVSDNVANEDASYRIENLEVNGDNANAQLIDQNDQRSDVLFQREDGGWRIGRIAGVGG
jgi:hypothetical protein